jgi:hypothetical protein
MIPILKRASRETSMYDKVQTIYNYNNQPISITNSVYNKEYMKDLMQKLNNKQQEDLLETKLNNKVNKKDGRYYLSITKKNKIGWGNTMTKIEINPITTMYDIIGLSDEIIQKARIKLIQYESIDMKVLKTFITWLNKELPKLSIIDDIIPLTARLLKDTMENEVHLRSIVNSKITTIINDLKDNKMKQIYQSESLLSKIFRFVRNAFTLTTEKTLDLDIQELDF